MNKMDKALLLKLIDKLDKLEAKDKILLMRFVNEVDELEFKISNLEKMVNKISEMRWYYELLERHKEK